MEVIILAGGLGTRLRSVVSNVPKPMAPIGNRPFLEILMDHLLKYGTTLIVLSTGYLHEKIERHFGSAYKGVALTYAVEDEPLGTGGGIRNAVAMCDEDNIVVVNGDTLFSIDYDELANFHQRHQSRLSVVLRQVDDVSRYGSVQTDCADRINRFTEKGCSGGFGTINGGIYMMHRSLIEEFAAGRKFSFEKDILQSRYVDEPFYGYTSGAFFLDIGIPEDYLKLCELYK